MLSYLSHGILTYCNISSYMKRVNVDIERLFWLTKCTRTILEFWYIEWLFWLLATHLGNKMSITPFNNY